MRWFTSDLHIGHYTSETRNIITYCKRPFPDVPTMNEAILARWRATVAPDDEVWVLGDVVLGHDWRESLYAIAALPGRKVLVAGNHDKCWHGHGAKHARYVADYEVAFDVRQGTQRLTIDGIECDVSHFPYVDEVRERPDKYAQWRPRDEGRPLLCGHVHEKWRRRGCEVNVGVDQWEFAPVAETTLAALLRAI